jgi:hypothetical protein
MKNNPFYINRGTLWLQMWEPLSGESANHDGRGVAITFPLILIEIKGGLEDGSVLGIYSSPFAGESHDSSPESCA